MRLEVPLPPARFQRPRPGKHSGSYYSPHAGDLENWRLVLRNAMKVEGHEMMKGPVSIHMICGPELTSIEVLPVVGSEPARPQGIRADLDNIVKFNMDALEGPVYFNDVQVIDLRATFG